MRVEHHGDTTEYYLIVKADGSPTHDTVRFFISGMPSDSHNVYVQVLSIDTSYAKSFLFRRVVLDSIGAATVDWPPSAETTGIAEVWVGYADTLAPNPESTFQRVGNKLNLTLEAVKRGGLWDDEDCNVYYCQQFFGPDSAQATSFVLLRLSQPAERSPSGSVSRCLRTARTTATTTT
jgi:hypothetical protein